MAPSPACGKTPSAHSHRRTADRASENVTAALPGPRHRPGPLRHSGSSVVQDRDHRVQPEQARGRPQDRLPAPPPRRLQPEARPGFLEGGLDVPAAAVGADHRAGVSAGSVVKKYSSRCVPVASRTNTHRIGTSPSPALYQCPVPVDRLHPPGAAPVPGDRQPGAGGAVGGGLAGLGQPLRP